jgi:hypothetical protein
MIAIAMIACSLGPAGAEAALAQAPLRDYRAILDAARRDTAETDSIRITDLDLGRAVVGTDTFTAVLHNKTQAVVKTCLDLRATPGLWLYNFQRQWCFDAGPLQVRHIAVTYQFRTLSPQATLRVRFGRGLSSGYVASLFYDKRYELGRDNPAALAWASEFTRRETQHLDIWAWRGSRAERDLTGIAARRERALTSIAQLLGVPVPDTVRLVFYPDSASYAWETGYVGVGQALGTTLLEIHNDSVQLNPYHELVHIVASKLGEPPALFREGLAVYLSERLGSDALKLLGSPGRTVDGATCVYARRGLLIPLDSLFDFPEIGSPASRFAVAYPEAASFVKFLIERYGFERFRQAYGALRDSDSTAAQEGNRVSFQRTIGVSVPRAEGRWREHLGCSVQGPPN